MNVRKCWLWLVPGLVAVFAPQACAEGEVLDDATLRGLQEWARAQGSLGPIGTVAPTTDPSATGTLPLPTATSTDPVAMPTAPFPAATAPAVAPGAAGGAPGVQPGLPPPAPTVAGFEQLEPSLQALVSATPIAARYQPAGTDANVGFDFVLRNAGEGELPLSEITVRYWYTSDEIPTLQSSITSVGAAVGTPDGVSAVHIEDERGRQYIEFGFSSGTLSSDDAIDAAQIQYRAVLPETHASLDTQADDYSFDLSARLSEDYDKLTIYRQGQLVWGVEPAAP